MTRSLARQTFAKERIIRRAMTDVDSHITATDTTNPFIRDVDDLLAELHAAPGIGSETLSAAPNADECASTAAGKSINLASITLRRLVMSACCFKIHAISFGITASANTTPFKWTKYLFGAHNACNDFLMMIFVSLDSFVCLFYERFAEKVTCLRAQMANAKYHRVSTIRQRFTFLFSVVSVPFADEIEFHMRHSDGRCEIFCAVHWRGIDLLCVHTRENTRSKTWLHFPTLHCALAEPTKDGLQSIHSNGQYVVAIVVHCIVVVLDIRCNCERISIQLITLYANWRARTAPRQQHYFILFLSVHVSTLRISAPMSVARKIRAANKWSTIFGCSCGEEKIEDVKIAGISIVSNRPNIFVHSALCYCFRAPIAIASHCM